MVLFNYAIREITAKIVYYGPGLCGKTTNLQKIHQSLDSSSRGKLISLATDADRTLFFDFLPLDLGKIGGYRIRFQLYTVPGQVHYNATRKLVLKGVDAVVFVADSQIEMLERNRESYDNLKENLGDNGYDYRVLPIIFQFNKRDLPNVASCAEIAETMGIDLREVNVIESVALDGRGVFETLKAMIKVAIRKLRNQFDEGQFSGTRKSVAPAPKSEEEKDASPIAAPEKLPPPSPPMGKAGPIAPASQPPAPPPASPVFIAEPEPAAEEIISGREEGFVGEEAPEEAPGEVHPAEVVEEPLTTKESLFATLPVVAGADSAATDEIWLETPDGEELPPGVGEIDIDAIGIASEPLEEPAAVEPLSQLAIDNALLDDSELAEDELMAPDLSEDLYDAGGAVEIDEESAGAAETALDDFIQQGDEISFEEAPAIETPVQEVEASPEDLPGFRPGYYLEEEPPASPEVAVPHAPAGTVVSSASLMIAPQEPAQAPKPAVEEFHGSWELDTAGAESHEERVSAGPPPLPQRELSEADAILSASMQPVLADHHAEVESPLSPAEGSEGWSRQESMPEPGDLAGMVALLGRRSDQVEQALVEIRRRLDENHRMMERMTDIFMRSLATRGEQPPEAVEPEKKPHGGWFSRFFGLEKENHEVP